MVTPSQPPIPSPGDRWCGHQLVLASGQGRGQECGEAHHRGQRGAEAGGGWEDPGFFVAGYPLVNLYITIGKSPFLMGKSTISTGPCSIANC